MRLVALLAASAALSASGDVDETQFRHTRTLSAPAGAPVRFAPDASLYGHTRTGFPDLRVLDAEGAQVPWRPEPVPAAVPSRSVPLVARGRRAGAVSVVIDRGAVRPVVDRIDLDVPDVRFTGSVIVHGSQTGAEGSYATLSTTPIYSVRGAVDARSTTAVFPATDYRFLLVRARGVSDITGARVAREPTRASYEPVVATTQVTEADRTTVVQIDLGFPNVPVDAVSIRAETPQYVRSVRVEGSNDGSTFVPLTRGRIARFPGVEISRIEIEARHRFLRVSIENGDDAPLVRPNVVAEAVPRLLLLASGHRPPFRLLYGAPTVAAPEYDFARLPPAATGFEDAVDGTLDEERSNPAYAEPADERTFFERNAALVNVLLVAGAMVVAVGGLLALRSRT